MRFHQNKASCDTAFAGLGHSVLPVALVTGFLSLHPALKGYALENVMRIPTVEPGGLIALDVHRKDPHRAIFSLHHKTHPTKTPPSRFKSTSTTPLFPVAGNKAIPGIIFCASLISVATGAALVFGSYGHGSSSAGQRSSESGRDGSEQGSSASNNLGGRLPPSDGFYDPSDARNVSLSRSPNHNCEAGGSPPPPPPPSECVMDDGKSGLPLPIDWTSFFMVLAYLLGKFNFGRNVKESSHSDISISHTPVGLSWDSLDDLVEDEFTSFSQSNTTSVLVTSSLSQSTVNIQNGSGARTITPSHNVLPTSPNNLPLHENTFCSLNDKPTLINTLLIFYSMLVSVVKFAVLSVLVFSVDALHSLFTVFICGTAAWAVGLVTQSRFDHEAEPEDIDEASLSYFMTTVDPNEDYVAFEPAEFYHVPEFGPPTFVYSHPDSENSIFPYIFNLFVPTEPQPVDELKSTDPLFVIPGFEIPDEAASITQPAPLIIEDWEETFNVNAPLREPDPIAHVSIPTSCRIVEFSRPELSSIPVFETTRLDRHRSGRGNFDAEYLQHIHATFGGYSRMQQG